MAVPVAVEEESKRRRFLRNPFKKEKKEQQRSDEAVADMRDFVEGLTGQPAPMVERTAPVPVPEPERTLGAESEPNQVAVEEVEEGGGESRRRFRLFRRKDDVEQLPEPAAEEVAIESKKLEPVPLTPKPATSSVVVPEAADDAAEAVVEENERRRWLRLPFGRKDEEPGEVEAAEDSDTAATEVADSPPEPTEGERRRLLRLPFAKDREAEIVPPETETEEVPVAEEEALADAPPEEPRRRLLRLPFGKGDIEEAEPEAPEEVAVVSEEPKAKKGGFLSRLGRGSKSDDAASRQEAATGRNTGSGDRYVVTVDGTPFYAIGPSQPMPPEAILSKGSQVTMRTAGWGWCDVVLPDGQMGVVATKNLRKSSGGGSYASRRSDNRRHWRVLNFNPAPEPDLPSDSGGMPMELGLLPPLDDE